MKRQRPERLACAWCEREFPVAARGRLPKWCSDTRRHRAWEQSRAARSGRAAVELVERIVTVERTSTRIKTATPTGAAWSEMLDELTRQLDSGALYERDFPVVHPAVVRLAEAVQRRLRIRQRRRR